MNLELSVKEQERLDVEVGLYRTKEVTFGSYLHEWSKEKKAPEQVYYWNAKLSNEIEAEADLYLRHLFSENKDNNTMPSLDYFAKGFEKQGITVLFGGDHGDKNCPISCKMNMSPPELRKTKEDLGYHCPVIQFASIQCSKDAFELMDKTVMPMVNHLRNVG